jgi:hypothetical protein
LIIAHRFIGGELSNRFIGGESIKVYQKVEPEASDFFDQPDIEEDNTNS